MNTTNETSGTKGSISRKLSSISSGGDNHSRSGSLTFISNKMTHFRCVGEFHDTFGHPLRTTPYNDCFSKDPKLVPFRISLIKEELNEFKDALKNNDLVEMADALCDLSYVTNGAGHCLGIDLDNMLMEFSINLKTTRDMNTVVDPDTISKKYDIIQEGLTKIEKFVNDFSLGTSNKDIQLMEISLIYLL